MTWMRSHAMVQCGETGRMDGNMEGVKGERVSEIDQFVEWRL